MWDGAERSVRIDGEPTLAGVPELERLGASRHDAYVVTAARLTGSTWEVSVAPAVTARRSNAQVRQLTAEPFAQP